MKNMKEKLNDSHPIFMSLMFLLSKKVPAASRSV